MQFSCSILCEAKTTPNRSVFLATSETKTMIKAVTAYFRMRNFIVLVFLACNVRFTALKLCQQGGNHNHVKQSRANKST